MRPTHPIRASTDWSYPVTQPVPGILPGVSTTVPRLRESLRTNSPNLAVERRMWDLGHEVVVGVDEVGRGAWAGPISVGAVVVPRNSRVYKIRDSKMLTETLAMVSYDYHQGPTQKLPILQSRKQCP